MVARKKKTKKVTAKKAANPMDKYKIEMGILPSVRGVHNGWFEEYPFIRLKEDSWFFVPTRDNGGKGEVTNDQMKYYKAQAQKHFSEWKLTYREDKKKKGVTIHRLKDRKFPLNSDGSRTESEKAAKNTA